MPQPKGFPGPRQGRQETGCVMREGEAGSLVWADRTGTDKVPIAPAIETEPLLGSVAPEVSGDRRDRPNCMGSSSSPERFMLAPAEDGSYELAVGPWDLPGLVPVRMDGIRAALVDRWARSRRHSRSLSSIWWARSAGR